VQAIGNRLKLRFEQKAQLTSKRAPSIRAGSLQWLAYHSGPDRDCRAGTLTTEETEGCFIDYPQGSVLFEGGPGHIHNRAKQDEHARHSGRLFLSASIRAARRKFAPG